MMKNYTRSTLFVLTLLMSWHSNAQTQPGLINLGRITEFKAALKQKMNKKRYALRGDNKSILEVQVPDGKSMQVVISFQEEINGELTIAGHVLGFSNSSYFLSANDDLLTGHIILNSRKLAYTYRTGADRSVFIEKTDINEVVCIGLPKAVPQETQQNPTNTERFENIAAYDLQSLPGAEACVYLDYDGHYLPAGSRWNNGNPINAAPSGFSNAEIQESWEVVAEDFRPFNVNITTSKAVFDSYPTNRRQWCVFTPTNTAAPGAGGVAYLNSFGFIANEVCWVFQGGAKFSGEAASHEIGHTIGLSHDGRTNPREEYFSGHGSWAPIMGVGYSKPITQWSRGEYNQANNQEDDFSIMDNYLRFRGDDHGNGLSNATFMGKNNSGQLDTQYGVISNRTDKDFFRFTCGTGNVTIDVNTVTRHGNLNILVDLYEGSTGNRIGRFNGNGLNTRVNAFLGEGTYYISVDGTGSGNPSDGGYSDYASLGSFYINGTVPAGGGNNNAVVTLYEDCSFNGRAVLLGEGRYTLAQLQPLGFVNDRTSSLRVREGYKTELYWDDNFSGASLVKTSDDACLTDDGNWNDKMSSIIVSKINTSGFSQLIEAEDYNDMLGVQTENCSEGGLNVGYIDTGDWMAYYNINFPTSGAYFIEYRVASAVNGARLSADLNAGNTILGEVSIPNTGGWQNWTTVSHTVNITEGTYQFGLFAASGGWNVNWIKISKATTAAVAMAENVNKSHKIATNTLYPNPVKNTLFFNMDMSGAWVSIVNSQGFVSRHKVSNTGINISAFEPGIYTVIIEKEGKRTIQRFVKK